MPIRENRQFYSKYVCGVSRYSRKYYHIHRVYGTGLNVNLRDTTRYTGNALCGFWVNRFFGFMESPKYLEVCKRCEKLFQYRTDINADYKMVL